MKLYLTSYRIPTPQELFDLCGKGPSDLHVAMIPNAKDYYAERARSFKINEMTQYFNELGVKHVHIIDLNKYADPEELKSDLSSHDLIWVKGGNTFCLMDAIVKSGFDRVIRNVLASGRTVYGGESAGACVAGTSLKGLEGSDEPAFAENIVWEGMSLIPNFLLPHADNPAFADEIIQIKEQYKNDPSLLTLNDNQALVIDGKQSRITAGDN